MPPELATPLSLEREVEQDPQVRIEAADAIYLIAQQVQRDACPPFPNVNCKEPLAYVYCKVQVFPKYRTKTG